MIHDNRMIYPPIAELTEDNKFNRYELVVGVAKGARRVTGEYLQMRADAEELIAQKGSEKPLFELIEKDYREQKPVRIAITRIHEGKYRIVRTPADDTADTGKKDEEV